MDGKDQKSKHQWHWQSLASIAFVILSLFLAPQVCLAEPGMSWTSWVQQLRQEALAQGIRPSVFDHAFANVPGPDSQVLRFSQTQPEKRLTFIQYRNTRIDNLRINLGQKEFARNRVLLTQIGKDFQVDPCVITAIWGMETSYGRYLGDFPVIKSLATLAYDSKRTDYFRSELLVALHIINDDQVDIADFKGEWAGASGYPQFMPSSWQKYAVDYDQTGRKDIWHSVSDGLASIGNYLAMNGWQIDQPSSIQISLPADFDRNLLGLNTTKPVSTWEELGINATNGYMLPAADMNASIVEPNGGPTFMVFNNFKVIMQYNKSVFYAASIGYLADKICYRE